MRKDSPPRARPTEAVERAKLELIEAHETTLRHLPDHTRTRCAVCEVPIPCSVVVQQVAVMMHHRHLVSDLDRKRAEHGEHGCDAWIWPYHY